MKYKLIIITAIFLLAGQVFGQVSGNMNYQYKVQLPVPIINGGTPNTDNFVLSIKGLCNVKADAYVAIFSLTQAGITASEVNQLMEERIGTVEEFCDKNSDMSFFVDMISFVPVYEFDLVKKIFSKKTYNEVPKGFELKKNIHIKYKDPNLLNQLLAVCSSVEIYDLVRVDYFSDSIGQLKGEMMTKAMDLISTKLKNRASILDVDISNYERRMSDAFTVVYPVEMYNAYQAFSSNSIKFNDNSTVNNVQKPTTHYYKPYFDKNFDFVINSIIFEPVIQIMYEIQVIYSPKKKEVKVIKPEVKVTKEIQVQKEVVIVTQSGDMKTIGLGTK